LISKTRPYIQGTHKHLRLPTETGLLVFLRCAEIFASEGASRGGGYADINRQREC
jgi:hypothetical protein